MIKKIYLASIIYLLPFFAFAQDAAEKKGIQPDCFGTACSMGHFLQFINELIEFLIFKISVPVAVLLVLYAGFLYLTTAVKDQKAKAKNILWAVVIGFIIMLGAWLLIDFILSQLLDPSFREIPQLVK
jgi:apolipoprotein N-acyltransferase